MSLINELIRVAKSKISPSDEPPEGLCPNCWGRQHYGDQYFEAVKNHGLDVNSIDGNVGWVQEYAEKYLQGIKLIDTGDKYTCQTCKITYRKN